MSGAFSIAVALITFGGTAMSAALVGLYDAPRGVPLVHAARLHEAVTFVAPAQPAPPRRDLSPTPTNRPTIRHRTAAVAPRDRSATMSTAAEVVARNHAPVPDSMIAEGGRSKVLATAGVPSPERAASLVFVGPSRFSRSPKLGPVERDSVLHRLSSAVPSLARTRRPTRVEVDSLYRQETLRQKLLWEYGRPVPIPVSAGSISFPLFSRGPSRAKRMRDSLIHHDNLSRFERIAERARAKRDSTRRADSLATKPDAPLP